MTDRDAMLAAETELTRIRDIVRERLGKVPCEKCRGNGWHEHQPGDGEMNCLTCGGTGSVWLADTMPLVDAVQMLLRQRDDLERRLKILFDWYNHDGSDGGIDRAFEEASSK